MEYTEEKSLTEWVVETKEKAESQIASLQQEVFEYRSNIRHYAEDIETGIVYQEQLRENTLNLIDSILHYQDINRSLETIRLHSNNISEHRHFDGRTYDAGDVREEIDNLIDSYDDLIDEALGMCFEAEKYLDSEIDTQEVFRKKNMRQNSISEVNNTTFVSTDQSTEDKSKVIEMFFNEKLGS